MPTLLHIDSSPLYGRSVSRQLTGAFVTQWKSSHLDGTVIDRDLNAAAISPITAEWVGAAYSPEEARTAQQKGLLAVSDVLLAELEQADEYVIGVPMHNFGVSFEKLIDDYVSDVHRRNPGAGCAFSALAPEIARSDKRTRALTTDQVKADLELLVGLLPGWDKRAARSKAILTFSALVGAMSLARAVSDEALSREILKTVADLLKRSA
jgi:FMN-dependent NADH-azoreductase